MASVVAAPIRQPRGPSSNSFGSESSPCNGPPAPDSESLLRRYNTVSNPRHQASASISSTSAASSAFHGGRFRNGSVGLSNRLRSGSLSSGSDNGGLSRKGSGRASVAARTEEAVIESGEEGTMETGGSWGKGLSRQSSLPSRRGEYFSLPEVGYNDLTDSTGLNPVTAVIPAPSPDPPKPSITVPPPRPPRRISVAAQSTTPPPPVPNHSVSHSLSSLAMLGRPNEQALNESDENLAQPSQQGANVSRTQSLRAQAKNAEASGLGRSSSLRSAGEQYYRPMRGMAQAPSPPTQPATPHHLFTPPTPPPMSSTAALPPMQLPIGEQSMQISDGAEVKRHQSLTQGYGSSNRVRDRLERSPALLSLEQREDLRRRLAQEPTHARKISEDPEEPPTSPIGRSVWSMSHPEDDGWSRPGSQQLQDAFEAMQLGRRMMGMENGQKDRVSPNLDAPRPPPRTAIEPAAPIIGHPGEEPSWVSNLVGMPDRLSPQPVNRTAASPIWQDRDAYLRGEMPQRWPEQNHYLNQPMGYLQQQQQQQQLFAAQGYGNMQGMKQGLQIQPQMGPYPQPYQPAYLGTPFTPLYSTPPVSAMPPSGMPAQDRDVIELARRKGLNPATFNCSPQIVSSATMSTRLAEDYQARFFVIKSYTVSDLHIPN